MFAVVVVSMGIDGSGTVLRSFEPIGVDRRKKEGGEKEVGKFELWTVQVCFSDDMIKAGLLGINRVKKIQVQNSPVVNFYENGCNELKARTKEKPWTVALSVIPDWPRIEAVAEFRLRTGHDCLPKHLHRLGVYTQPTCPLCNLQEEMEKTNLIRCPALKTTMENQRYWEARRLLMNCY
ncbi:unnamed protein product [Rodentolepis nana]|uniref:Zf-RVT domain-containing protein n=1 Tax=Rodentolepis nana TaxID=102285 RepID=A0A158QJ33_RODNA|nr:unnamed protein product [Rodentolepis nana]